LIYLFKIGFLEIGFVDFVDVLLVSILLGQAYKLIRGSVAIKVFIGFLSLYLIYLVVRAAEMELLTSILGQFMGVGVLAVIILFQQEIRKFLLIIGRTAFDKDNFMKNLRGFLSSTTEDKAFITPIVEAAKALGGSGTGALIVISKNSQLKFYAESGDPIDAITSKRMLMAIFNKYSPLHDGAVIVYKNRIVAARCILPVTDQTDLPAQYGLRHRAAIGMSEITETLVVIVSEEMGQLATVKNGRIRGNLSPLELRQTINEYLEEESAEVKDEIETPAILNDGVIAPSSSGEPNPLTQLMEEAENSGKKKVVS